MKKLITKIREFFWPLLEKEIEVDSAANVEPIIQLKISDDNLEQAFKLKSQIFDSEEDRRKGIETKSSLFISTISVATSVVVAANALITGTQEYNLPVTVSVIMSFILSVYAVRTVWFSIKALERGSYHVLDFTDINVSGTTSQYYKHLIQTMQNKVDKNEAVINKKVDYFTLAQEYYKRAIIIICIYSFLVLLFCLFFKKQTDREKEIENNSIKVFTKDSCWQFDTRRKFNLMSIRPDCVLPDSNFSNSRNSIRNY